MCCDHHSICQRKYLKAVAQAGKLVLHTLTPTGLCAALTPGKSSPHSILERAS